jgi:hypothetical protein
MRIGEGGMTVWSQLITPALAAAFAACITPIATNGQIAGNDNSAVLELRIQPKDIRMDVPQAFAFLLVNVGNQDARVPTPSVYCSGLDGTLSLRLDFVPLAPGEPGSGGGCGGTITDRPPILKRVKEWKLLHPGESLTVEAGKNRLHFEDREPGTYEFWATYQPPQLSPNDQAELRQAGIDFPQAKLSSAHVVFIKKP